MIVFPISFVIGSRNAFSIKVRQKTLLVFSEKNFFSKSLETNVSVLYKGEKGNTPLNSLSSFVLRSSESDQMIESYGNKYAKDTELLKTFIKSL